MADSYLILHGLGSRRPAGHWQHQLAAALRARGHEVGYPQLPAPDRPDLPRWLDVLATGYAALGGGERVVVCHSLACALWARAAERGLDRPADRVLLVAPPGPALLAGQVAAGQVSPGFAEQWSAAAMHASSRAPVRLVASDDDPFCIDGPAAAVYGAPLGMDAETLTGAGHLSMSDGYGPWPAVVDWCVDGGIRFAH